MNATLPWGTSLDLHWATTPASEPELNEKVNPATPTMLIALPRAVAYGWRQEALALSGQEVADLGKQLYERIVNLAEQWTDLGNRLDKAVEAYNKSVATLESRVLVSAWRLRDLKAAPEDIEGEVIELVERTEGRCRRRNSQVQPFGRQPDEP